MNQTRDFFLRCKQCRTKNRIPQGKIGTVAKCGHCKTAIDTRELLKSAPIMVTDANFEETVLRSSLPILLDCWATWCSACATLSPVLETMARDFKGRFRVAKLNVEANPMLTAKYDLRSLPTLLIFDKGQLKDMLVGALPKEVIFQKMSPFIG